MSETSETTKEICKSNFLDTILHRCKRIGNNFFGSNCTNSLIFANKSKKFHLAIFIHEDDLLKLKCQFPMQKLLDDKVLSENNEKENIQSCFFSASSQFMCPA